VLQRRWDAFNQQLHLLCYVMHPAKLLEGLDETAAPLHGINLALYAADLYELFWGEDANARSRISVHASFFRGWIGCADQFQCYLPDGRSDTAEAGTLASMCKLHAAEALSCFALTALILFCAASLAALIYL